MRALARQAVSRFAGMEPGRPVGGTYYLYRTLRNLDLDGVLEQLMEQAARRSAGGELTPLEERLEQRRVREPHRAAQEGDRGRDPPPPGGRPRRRGHGQDAAQAAARGRRLHARHPARRWRRCARRIYPLTRKLAVRLARKRRHGRKGPLDFRSTVRHSLSYGGVPAEPKFRYPRPAKPEIIVIADISGSVAAFARFTLHLVYAIPDQFSKVRAFVFIDGIDEVTELLRGRRGHHRGRPPGQHRGRRRLGRRPLRLRPRLRGVLGALRQGDRPQDHGPPPRRRAEQLPRRPELGRARRCATRPATCTG